MKDVGFPDVKSGRTAASKGTTSIELNEAHSDLQKPTEIIDSVHVDENDRGDREEDTSSLRRFEEDGEKLSSESHSEQTLDETNKVAEDICEEEGHNVVENREAASDGDEENVRSNFDGEDGNSSTDLDKLKNLLEEEGTSDTAQTKKNGQECSAFKETNETGNLDSYFQELEDDMFGWESSGDENDENEKESILTDNNREITNEESLGENKEASNTQIQEGRNDASSGVNNEATSSQLDSSEDEHDHSLEETKTDDAHEPDEIRPLKDQDIEIENVDTNLGGQPTEDASPLEANEFISNREEQCPVDQTKSSNDNGEGEAQQMEPSTSDATPNINSSEEPSQTPVASNTQETPDEKKEGQTDISVQEDTPTPKFPLFNESEGRNRQDEVTVPPSDEVRKQLKDILVDVRFFLGMCS